jgi:hypothetical protein
MTTEDWQMRSRLTLAFAIGFSLLGLLVTLCSTMMLITRSWRRGEMHMTAVNGSIRVSPAPSGRIPSLAAPVAQSVETALESSADQVSTSGSDTTLIKTFALVPGSKFSIKNINGSISVEAWDQPGAEVKVVKRGPDRGAQVFFTNGANNLSLRTGVPGGSTNSQDVRYEVKLPREMGRIELKSVNGSTKLSYVNAQIFVESTNGSIELDNFVGVSKVQNSNGKINAVLAGASNGPMEFSSVNSNIDVTVKSDFDAALEASTVYGSLNIDNQFGILVQKEIPGQHARGQLGAGGQPLKLTAVNGSVHLSRQQ